MLMFELHIKVNVLIPFLHVCMCVCACVHDPLVPGLLHCWPLRSVCCLLHCKGCMQNKSNGPKWACMWWLYLKKGNVFKDWRVQSQSTGGRWPQTDLRRLTCVSSRIVFFSADWLYFRCWQTSIYCFAVLIVCVCVCVCVCVRDRKRLNMNIWINDCSINDDRKQRTKEYLIWSGIG